MKLRFHADSLRLRLSQPEVAQLAETGRVENTITFAPGQTISYAVESGPEASITASFVENTILVVLPAAAVKRWMNTDRPEIEAASATLRVLIEKDFQCLHGPGAEEPDAFPNPMAKKR